MIDIWYACVDIKTCIPIVCRVHSSNDDSPTAGVSVIRVSGPESGSSLAALCSKGSKMPAERQVREQSHVTKLPLPPLKGPIVM